MLAASLSHSSRSPKKDPPIHDDDSGDRHASPALRSEPLRALPGGKPWEAIRRNPASTTQAGIQGGTAREASWWSASGSPP